MYEDILNQHISNILDSWENFSKAEDTILIDDEDKTYQKFN